MTSNPTTFISLYSGAGGLDLGFSQAGALPRWANDFDRDATETYRQNLGGHVTCGDIQALRGEIPDKSPSLVIGGPPCQGFSVAGHMRPDDPRSEHVWTFLDVVQELQPRGFVMENVKNLAVNTRWAELMASLLAFAEAAGYTTRVWLLNASHYGVPQGRERMFMVGIRGREPAIPPSTTKETPPTVREALDQLPPIGAPGNNSICTARVTPARNPVLRRSPFAGMLFNGKGRPLNLDAPASTLPASMGGNRTPIVDQFQLERQVKECWIIEYHRHLWDGGKPIARIPERMRRLTVEEASAIQTFPYDWQFIGTQSSRYRQIGNAVPPTLARAVATQVLKDMATHASQAAPTLAGAASV